MMTAKQLFFIGLGLYDDQDISIKGIHALQKCDQIFAEFYTSQSPGFNKQRFEQQIGKSLTILTREQTEKGDIILHHAQQGTVGFLTAGDPLIATTHIDLRIRAIKLGISTHIIHAGSIVTAVPGLLGLQNYKFGRTTTLAYPEKSYFPTSPYTVIKDNKENGLHTLLLLDIQADKQRYMTAHEAIQILIELEKHMKYNLITSDTLLCVVARAGSASPVVQANTIQNLQQLDFGPPLHTLVLPGALHFMEIEALEHCAGLPAEVAAKLQKH